MSQGFHARPYDTRNGAVLDIFGDLVSIKVSGADTNGAYTVLTSVTPPMGGPPLHTHVSDSETFLILEGTFVFELDGVEVNATAGDTVFIPAGVQHLYQNVGSENGRMLLVVEPAGLDDFFIELDRLLREPGPPNMQAIDVLHTKYRMKLEGPPRAARG